MNWLNHFLKTYFFSKLVIFSFVLIVGLSVVITAQTPYCDTITLNSNIPDSVFLCGEDSTIISADIGFVSYEWSRGDTVNEVAFYYSGKYYLTITDDSSCVSVDSVTVSLINASITQPDTLLCFGESLTIQTEQNSPNFTSIDFDGLSSYVDISDAGFPTGNQQRSFEAWIYNEGQNGLSCIFSYGSITVDEVFAIYLDQNDSLKLKINTNTYVCNQIVPQNTWTHISVGTDQSLKYTFIINGLAINSDIIQVTYNTTLSSDAYLGKDLSVISPAYFNGLMDEVRIWNRFVSGNEFNIKLHLNSLTDSDLLRFWDFNYITANQSNDVYGLAADLNSITSSTNIPFNSYIFSMNWSTGDFGDSLAISPNSGQFYYLFTSDNISECIDSVYVDVALPLSLTDSLFVCNQASVELVGGAGYDSYLWNTGEIQEVISVTSGGMYSLETNLENCYFEDSTFVSLINIEIIQSDTSICRGETITLNAISNYSNYYWSNDVIISTIIVSPLSSTSYQVSSTDGYNTCYASINVTLFPEVVIGLNDTTVSCNQTSAGIFVSNPNFSSYEWDNGDTTQLTFVSSPGFYYVTVVDVNTCSAIDSVFVDLLSVSILQEDTIVCGSSSLQLNAIGSTGNFVWSTGETGASIVVNSTVPTTYIVSVSNGSYTCEDDVNVGLLPAINLNLPDTLISCNDTIFSLYAVNGQYDYIWSNGFVFPSIQVSQSGQYSVTVTDMYGCEESDVTVVSIIDAYLTISETLICQGEEVIVSTNSSGFDYLWSNGLTDAIIFDYPAVTTNYHVYISDDYATCHYVASIDVITVETGLITGPIEVWQDSTVEYSIVPNSGSTYEWFISGGLYSNNTGSVVEVTWNNIVAGYIAVTETTTEGCVGNLVEIDVTVIPNISIDLLDVSDEILIIPNPLQSISTVVIPDNFTKGEIKIFDVSGRLFRTITPSGEQTIQLNRSNFSAGIYTIIFISDDIKVSKLLVE